MVLYYQKSFLNNGREPADKIDPNTKTDYAKLDRIVRLYKIEGDRKGVLLEIAQNGFILVSFHLFRNFHQPLRKVDYRL